MRHVLILDDEQAVLHALQRTLRLAFPARELVIEMFSDPEAALLRAGQADFDLVISDYRMPGLNGADVLRLMKGLQPDAVRIVLSASTDPQEILSAVNLAGVFRFLAKPWEREELVATVRMAFEQRDLQLLLRRTLAAAHGAACQPSPQELELRRLEEEEPGITHVNRDEHGNVHL